MRRIMIIIRSVAREIENPTFGGPRLVKELKKELENKGDKVFVISLHECNSLGANLLKVRKKGTKRLEMTTSLKKEGIRWIFSLFLSLLAEFFSRYDLKLTSFLVEKIKEINPDIIIYNGSVGAFVVSKISKKLNIPFILCEHNVDYYFYAEKTGFLAKPFISLYKIIELSAYRNSDGILVFNPKDKERLVKDGIPSSKIIIWKFNIKPKKYDKKKFLKDIPVTIRNLVENKPVVCFLGADYTPNIIAVNYILKIAKDLPDVLFLVVGSVGERFKNRRGVPRNVMFTGYVKDVKPYLAIADIFLNLKFTSDTGIEAKMFDYLEYGKPIISTRIGAYGFEHCKNIYIVNDISEIERKIKELLRARKRE